ncbi:MAG: 16S rRNA (adenine(1518)-N(6)/adenine(1519)-N(6))-dimethyltransferase RsmA [Candidatus Acidiferrales bacterium]
MARQRLGQHFLGDIGWRKRILATLPLGPNDIWVEIGPGHGEMTQFLAGDGRRVIAVEADPRLAEGLRASADAQPQQWPGVEVVSGDVLETDIGRLATGNFHVYGNLPYYITSPILHHLFHWAGQIASIHIVIQLEVAERIVARPNVRDYGYLSTFCQFYAHPKIALRIPPGAFHPPPKVKSALVSMTLPGERAHLNVADEKRLLEFVQACFAQKRKTLRNNLLEIADDQKIHDALAATGLRSDARAEQLTLAQFAALFSRLSKPNFAGLPAQPAAGQDNSS